MPELSNLTSLNGVLLTGAVLFALGLYVIIARRNLFFQLMGVEMLLNAVNLTFLVFTRSFEGATALDGHIAMLFVIALAASEACIGLAMVIVLVRQRKSLDVDTMVDLAEVPQRA
jgi:NADH:ubiquinone oxidoreductase subunit K